MPAHTFSSGHMSVCIKYMWVSYCIFVKFTPFLSHLFTFFLHKMFLSCINSFLNSFINKSIPFIFVLPAFEAWLLHLKERKENTSKQVNKQKKNNFCFIGSEAEAHDVISDANVYYFLKLDECLALLTCRRWVTTNWITLCIFGRQLYKYQSNICMPFEH